VIFTVLYVLVISGYNVGSYKTLTAAVLFLVGIAVFCFVVLRVCGWVSRKNRTRQEMTENENL